MSSEQRGADFLSLVAHDLRSPLATVIGAAQTLQLGWADLTKPRPSRNMRFRSSPTSAGLSRRSAPTTRGCDRR